MVDRIHRRLWVGASIGLISIRSNLFSHTDLTLIKFWFSRKDPCQVFHPDYYFCGLTTDYFIIIHISQILQETDDSPNINTSTHFTTNHQFKIKSNCNHLSNNLGLCFHKSQVTFYLQSQL